MKAFDPTRHHLPAEWESHHCCWMAWPTGSELWGGQMHFEAAKTAYLSVANTISEFELVRLVVPSDEISSVSEQAGGNVELIGAEIEQEWMRDHGPTFIVDSDEGVPIAIDWAFNGYGMKYVPFHRTSRLVGTLMAAAGIERWAAPLVMEGGAIHWDGAGTLLATEECLLHDNRNPHLTKEDIEGAFRQYLGIEKTIWLPNGLVDDETDGHVDEVACFVGEAKILALVEPDVSDENHRRLRENMDVLSSATDAKGRALEIIELPEPSCRTHPVHGSRLALSHINFYIANGAVILPAFGEERYDSQAKETLAAVFPEREVVMVDGLPIAFGGGCIHCITQQQPSASGS